jgi:hypothetical protein
MLRWYEWGNEKPGYVSIWCISAGGETVHLGTLQRKYLPKDAIKESPYN